MCIRATKQAGWRKFRWPHHESGTLVLNQNLLIRQAISHETPVFSF
jgi:hypothetical protein